jgi:hypothetical protein
VFGKQYSLIHRCVSFISVLDGVFVIVLTLTGLIGNKPGTGLRDDLLTA